MSAAIPHVLPFRRAVPSCTPARRVLPLAWFVAVVLAPLATAETASPERLDTMVVTASPIARSLEELDQSVSLIGRDEIRGAAADNVADLLHFVSGVDVRQRGGRGVQADIGIRGTAFEQTLLMVDGVRMRDPQTGHHAMNLPVPMEHLERIEVLKGPGSAAYGPSATGGAINLITRRPDGFEAGLKVDGGEHGYRSFGGHLGTGDGDSGHLLSVAHRESDGHLDDEPTDFEISEAYYSGGWSFGEHSVSVGLGANERDFGAWKFYVDRFPDQREETSTRLAHVGAELAVGDWTLTPSVFWRRNEDWYLTRLPMFAFDSINEHETDVVGAELGARRSWQGGTTALGVSDLDEEIESSALGDHQRTEHSAWFEHRMAFGERLRVSVSGAWVGYSEYEDAVLPGASLGFDLRDDLTLFASAARSARVPSYTELFLPGGAGNQGNPELEAERSDFFEAGLRWQHGRQLLSAATFLRRTDDLIDWGRPAPDQDFVAGNFDDHRTVGGELSWELRPASGRLQVLRLGWTHLDTDLDERGLEMAYAHDHPGDELTLVTRVAWRSDLTQSLRIRHASGGESDSALLVSSKLAWEWRSLELSVEGSNLLDETYIEAGFAPQPGRWVTAGIAWRY